MSDLRSVDVVVHGTRADSDKLRAAVPAVRDLGHRVRVHVTWERGDARRFARRAAARGAGAVVAAGGDGTLNEVLNGVVAARTLDGARAPIGTIPLGTANDFARQAGIPSEPDAALRLAALSGVRQLAAHEPPTVARVSGPGFSREIPFFLLAVGNGRATGGGTIVTPLAELDDGLLDVCIVEPVARASYAKLLFEMRRGDHLEREGVHYVQTPWLRVEGARALAANVDGEPTRARTFAYAAEPSAVAVIAPPRVTAPDVTA